MRASFLASDRTYGAGRVWRDMLAEGVSCGLHRIERLMRLQALRARPRRRRLPPDLGERQANAVAANVLDRSFEAPAPNRKWIADFTYIWTAEGWLYVAAVVDLFSRRVVGWSMSASMTAQLVTDALIMAIWRRGKPDALLHHSDRGSQYTSEQFQRLMTDHGVTCSMSRSGNVWDNAAMESFFSSLKTERTARKTYRTRDDARADVFDYIERFYNAKRRHSTIGYRSPMEVDLEAGFDLGRRFELAISIEVAEHLSARAAEPFVHNLTRHAPAVLFSAAIPFQGGHRHVNEQFLSYWEALFAKHKFQLLDIIRGQVWEDKELLWWLRQNVVLFAHKELVDSNENLRLVAGQRVTPSSVVHPDVYVSRIKNLQTELLQYQALGNFLRQGGSFKSQVNSEGRVQVTKLPT